MTGEGLERGGAGRENWCSVKHASIGFYTSPHSEPESQDQLCSNTVQR